MSSPLRIVFLDFDGVLNSRRWFEKLYAQGRPAAASGKAHEIDPDAVKLLNELLERTGAIVVISSVWRFFGLMRCKDMLHARGFKGKVLDVTPRRGGYRGHEIQEWLTDAAERYEIERFVILDDDSDMVHLAPRLVQTNRDVGLTQDDVNRAAAMLEGDEPVASAGGAR